jgi:hypothetical protein
MFTDRYVVQLVELVNEWAHDGYVDADISELFQAEIVFHDRDDITSYPVDIGVHRQSMVRIRIAAEDWLGLERVAESPTQERLSLGLLNPDPGPALWPAILLFGDVYH